MPRDISALSRRQFSLTAAATASAVAVAPRLGTAQDATPVVEASPATPEVTIEVVTTGLKDPRFIATDGGAVYLTEAGTGGDTAVFEKAGPGTPEPAAPVSQRGTTGTLSRIDPDGTVTVVADGFQSYTFGGNGEIVGPAGVALDGAGKAYVTVGAPGPFISSIDLTGEENVLVEIDLATGEKQVVANLSPHEIEANPDPMAVDSNLYGLALREGVAYIADSGGNSILSVDIASGEVSTFAVTGGLDAPFLGEAGNPLRGGEMQIDSVPAGIRLGPDDRLYVTYVTGGPFPPGMSRVDAFTIDGQQDTFATGLTMVTDIAFASDGTAYAVIMSADLINGGPGKIVRLAADGNHMVVVDGLQLPNGLAFDANDTLYVTNKASFAIPGGGELLRMTGVTTATGTPLTPGLVTPEATPEPQIPESAETVNVVLGDMFFEPSEITIPANTDVVITLENRGFLQHDMYIAQPDVFSGVLRGGETGELVINLPPGNYEFWCTQIGHRQAGMTGMLTVK